MGPNAGRGIQRVNTISTTLGGTGRISQVDWHNSFLVDRIIVGPNSERAGSEYLGNFDLGTGLITLGIKWGNGLEDTTIPTPTNLEGVAPEFNFNGRQNFNGDSGAWRFEFFPIRRTKDFIKASNSTNGYSFWLARQANKVTVHDSAISSPGVDNITINTVAGGFAVVQAIRNGSGSITAVSNTDAIFHGGGAATIIQGFDFVTGGPTTNYAITHDGSIIVVAAISFAVS